MNATDTTPKIRDTIDEFVAQQDASMLETLPNPTHPFFVENLCRECGREVNNVMSEVCGKPDCQNVALSKAFGWRPA